MDFIGQSVFSWVPIAIAVGLWLFFMTRIRTTRQRELGELFQRLERVEALLGRIAVTLDRRGTR